MSRLFVVGDSFTSPPELFTFERPLPDKELWPEQVAKLLNLSLQNHSCHGSAQDFAWAQLHKIFKLGFNKNDRLIIVLTDPWRFWFFHDQPDTTNISIIDLENFASENQVKAISSYFTEVQRPQLDTMWLIHRLAWLDRALEKHNLAKPLIMLGFPQFLGEAEDYENYYVANGSLFEDVQKPEFKGYKENPELDTTYLLRGLDPRYNHLCYRNHNIMADKVVNFFQNGDAVDLTQGFHQGVFAEDDLLDDNFWEDELDLNMKDRWIKNYNEGRQDLVPFGEKLLSKVSGNNFFKKFK